MSKRTIAAIALTGALLLPSAALAESLEYDTPDGGGKGSCTSEVKRTTITNDELSANERIVADAWKSHLHARKARALEGLE